MIPWIQVYSNLIKHPKTYALADELKLSSKDASPNAIAAGLIISLWLWASQNASDGDLSRCTPRAIAEAAEYRKKPEAFVDALIKVRFLDPDKKLHDWEDHAAMLIDSIERSNKNNASRQQRYRDRRNSKHNDSDSVTTASDSNVTRNVTSNVTSNAPSNESNAPSNVTSNESNAPTIPYRTKPNQYTTTARINIDNGNTVTAEETPAINCGWMFTQFWEAYPKKIDRESAWEAWKKLNPSRTDASAILSALESWKISGQWTEDSGRFIPDAGNFLAKGYWRTSPPPAAKASDSSGLPRKLDHEEREAIQRILQGK